MEGLLTIRLWGKVIQKNEQELKNNERHVICTNYKFHIHAIF